MNHKRGSWVNLKGKMTVKRALVIKYFKPNSYLKLLPLGALLTPDPTAICIYYHELITIGSGLKGSSSSQVGCMCLNSLIT